MDAKSDRKIKKSTLLSWKCGDWIEIVKSERKSSTTSIQFKIFRKHQKKLTTLRNFNVASCHDPGTCMTNVKKDSVLTHMKGKPHKLAMKLEHESEFMKQPCPLPSYAATPLGKAFFKLNQQERERVKKLIEIVLLLQRTSYLLPSLFPLLSQRNNMVLSWGKPT